MQVKEEWMSSIQTAISNLLQAHPNNASMLSFLFDLFFVFSYLLLLSSSLLLFALLILIVLYRASTRMECRLPKQ